MRDDLPESPPLEPEEEVVLVDEPTFLNACKSLIAEDADRFEWSFGKSLLTRSERWGLIGELTSSRDFHLGQIARTELLCVGEMRAAPRSVCG
jgi:hypothetical protein